MGTRGTFGVHVDGVDKLSYNHLDSYPEGLGLGILDEIRTMISEWGLVKMTERARLLKQVDEESKPTAEEIATLHGFSDLTVSTRSPDEWYCLLRELQGKIMDTLVVGYSIEGNNFIKDSLFCEWGYVLNLDERVLEVYRGFQTEPHTKGRYASTFNKESYPGGDSYYPCALLISFPLDDLPSDEEFLIAINRAPFESDEEMVIDRLENYGDGLTAEDAAKLLGIDNLGEVIESIEAAGYKVEFDGESYTM